VVRGVSGSPRGGAISVSGSDDRASSRPSSDSRESGSFSLVFTPLRSSFACLLRRLLRAGTFHQGSFPSSRRPDWCPPVGEPTRSRYVPPTGFLNLSTVYSTNPFAGLFRPTATSRVLPFRGFSLSALDPARRRPCPLAVGFPALTDMPAATRGLPDFEALLRGKTRSSGMAFSPPFRSLPSSVLEW